MQILQLHDLMQDNCLLSFFPFFFFFGGGGGEGGQTYIICKHLYYIQRIAFTTWYLVRIIICDIRCGTLQYIMPPCSTKSCGIQYDQFCSGMGFYPIC